MSAAAAISIAKSGQQAGYFSDDLILQCPVCRSDVFHFAYSRNPLNKKQVRCLKCLFTFEYQGDICIALPPDRFRYYARFVEEYEWIRKREGRGSTESDFYLALPFQDLSGHNKWQWSIRSKSYQYLEHKILQPLARNQKQPLKILDLGAGNGWLSYRLARGGHFPVAVDLLTNSFDGLGAVIHFRNSLTKLFPCFQAELDRLPFADAQFDCAIFNASFHYSENYGRTLGEAIRCLRSGGTVIITDSPWYSRKEYGQKMVEERRSIFQKRFGFPSNSLSSSDYLTDEDLGELQERFQFHWKVHQPWYGLRWALRPYIAKLNKKRESARFRIYETMVKKA